MALRQHTQKKFKNVIWRSGQVYKFKYQAWNNDPEPVIVLINAYSGRHPTTQHEWHFFQGINFTYIPRSHRRQFAAAWMNEWESGRRPEFSWNIILTRYPYLKNAIRRYFYTPNYYITDVVPVPLEDMEQVIVSTWSKDFSKKLKTSLVSKFRKARSNVNKGLLSGFFGR